MRSIYAFERIEEVEYLQIEVEQMLLQLEQYITYLRKNYQLKELPQAIVWTNKDIATKILSTTPIPAYTNEQRMVVAPNIEEWRQLWKEILPSDVSHSIHNYFKNWEKIHVIQIIGHEITHHLDEFVGEFTEEEPEEIWFEEGMVEYLSRQYFLTSQQFQETINMERELVSYFESRYGERSLKDFGRETYETEEVLGIFYYYWKSFLKICEIVEQWGSTERVFEKYHQWWQEASHQSLLEWFSR